MKLNPAQLPLLAAYGLRRARHAGLGWDGEEADIHDERRRCGFNDTLHFT